MSYSTPTTGTYRFPAQTLTTGATLGRIIGPKGKHGRVNAVGVVVTTGVTVAATTVTVGTEADVDAYASLTVPVTAANLGVNGPTLVSGHELPADTIVAVATGGGCTAGAGDILVIIDWY